MARTSARDAVLHQVPAALATGARAVVADMPGLPDVLAGQVSGEADPAASCDAVLFAGTDDRALLGRLARGDGPVVPVLAGPDHARDMLVQEHVASTNTAAAGGNANLMTIG